MLASRSDLPVQSMAYLDFLPITEIVFKLRSKRYIIKYLCKVVQTLYNYPHPIILLMISIFILPLLNYVQDYIY
jgi:hypothetical protein